MSAPRPTTLGAKIGVCLFAAGVLSSLMLMDWRFAVAGVVALFVSTTLGAPTKESARIELVRLEAKIQRAHYLADQWEREAGSSYNTTTQGMPFEQLRHALDGTGR